MRSLSLLLAALLATPAAAEPLTDRLIVHWRSATSGDLGQDRLSRIASGIGLPLTQLREGAGTSIVALDQPQSLSEVTRLAALIAQDPAVAFAEPDRRIFPLRQPNDPYYAQQWGLQSSAEQAAAASLPSAWERSTGSTGVVVAVIDTGILPHTDLAGRTLTVEGQSYPYGYDFVSADGPSTFVTANDGDDRDPDPSDPGDWVTAAEASAGVLQGCPQQNSSWHGTHVAGIIGAAADNGIGVAGINWNSPLLPVRVMGKCGGYESDLADAIRWAAGGSVSGVPANSHPAQVINMSLGATGYCSQTMQSAIDSARAAGASVVVAAGNSGSNLDETPGFPASCDGVVTVAAVGREGMRPSYSSYGAVVDLAAPGGSTPLNPNGILSLLDSGTTSPIGDEVYGFYQGTSMATPHVSGVLSLMLSAYYELTGARLNASTAEQLLVATTRPFAETSNCTTATCGSGLLDAAGAVAAVTTPPTITLAAAAIEATPGITIPLSATVSDDGSVSHLQWQQSDSSGYTATLSGAQQATATAQLPSGIPNGTTLAFTLIATDNLGLSSSASVGVTITVTAAAPVLTEVPAQQVKVGQPLSFQVSASDADNGPPLLSASDLPSGASFVDNGDGSASFNWTPSAEQAGSYTITLTATDRDNAALTDSQALTISVTQGGGGGGGGLFHPLFALALLLSLRPWRARG